MTLFSNCMFMYNIEEKSKDRWFARRAGGLGVEENIDYSRVRLFGTKKYFSPFFIAY